MSHECTVIITCYNAAPYLLASIESVLGQTNPDFELVIVDDGSTDDTAEVLGAITDDRVRVLSPGRIGRAKALNLALDASTAEFVAVLDADDLALPDRLARQVQFLKDHPDVDVVGSRKTPMIDEDGRDRGVIGLDAGDREGARQALMRGRPPSVHSSVMMRRSFLTAAGGYDESLGFGLDVDLLSKAVAAGSFANLDAPVSKHRIHSGQFFRSNLRGAGLWERVGGKLELQARVITRLGLPRRYRWLPLWAAFRGRFQLWPSRGDRRSG